MGSSSRATVGSRRDIESVSPGTPLSAAPLPLPAAVLALQRTAGNRAVVGLLQRSVKGRSQKMATQNANRIEDRASMARHITAALNSADVRLRNSAQLVERGQARIFVGTPRHNSDQIVADKVPEFDEEQAADGTELKDPALAKLGRLAYIGTDDKRDTPLFRNGQVVQPAMPAPNPRCRDEEIEAEGTTGASDQKGTLVFYDPRTRKDETIFETLRHETQHQVDQTADLLDLSNIGAAQGGAAAKATEAQARGLAEFVTEQRAYTLEGPGPSYADLGEKAQFAVTAQAEPTFQALVGAGRAISIVKATAWLTWSDDSGKAQVLALLPADVAKLAAADGTAAGFNAAFWNGVHAGWAQRHENVPVGTVALIRELLSKSSYTDFTTAWLLDDLWGKESPARPFQHAVVRMAPDYVNPLNSPRIYALWQAVKQIKYRSPTTRQWVKRSWDALWDSNEEQETARPKPWHAFSKALEGLDRDELRFLVGSQSFIRYIKTHSDDDFVGNFKRYAADWEAELERIDRRLHAYRTEAQLRSPPRGVFGV